MKERGVRFPEVAVQTGIPAQRMYKWYQEKSNPKTEDSKIIEDWISGNLENVPRETTQEEPPKDRSISPEMEVILKLTNSNVGLVESNKTLADNTKELIAMMKNRPDATVDDPSEIHQVFASRLRNLQELVKGFVMGKRYGSIEEVDALLNKTDREIPKISASNRIRKS